MDAGALGDRGEAHAQLKAVELGLCADGLGQKLHLLGAGVKPLPLLPDEHHPPGGQRRHPERDKAHREYADRDDEILEK